MGRKETAKKYHYILRERKLLPEGLEIEEEISGRTTFDAYGYPLDGFYPLFAGEPLGLGYGLFGIAKNKEEMKRRIHDYLVDWSKENLKGQRVEDRTSLAAKLA